MKKPLIIGIAGGSASGKTSIANKLYEAFQGTHTTKIIRFDDYYKDQTHLTMEQRHKTNYDHPNAFDIDLMVEHIKDLKAGNAIEKPIYDFVEHNRSQEIEIVAVREVFIIEGLFVLNEKVIRDQCDILLYVDTDSDIRFIRRLMRDVEERGRSLESVVNQYVCTVRPMHEQFIETSKKYAHLIIPEGGSNHVAVDILITKINSILDKD